MERMISNMLQQYERGQLDRRQLVQSLAAVFLASANARGSTFEGVGINHIALRVTNVQRSRDFYQKHFGMPVLSESEGNCFLGLGKNFLTLFRSQAAGLDHYCIGIEGYTPNAVLAELKRQGLNPWRTADRIYFPDPDGLTVQVSASDHRP